MELYSRPAHELHDMLVGRQISARELTEAVLNRVDAVDDRVRSYLTVTADRALEQADGLDAALSRRESLSALGGIPAAVKDNLCTHGVRTTAASKILDNWLPPYDATVVQRLNEQRAVIVGKANLDEFAMGSSCENSGYFPTHNPWDLDRVPGGSSGGSCAAVAAGEAIFALGSDTGGSIRQPAALCGVVGMKPTYGRVSRYGLIAFASSLDQIGPITRDVTDCAVVLNAICGHDPRDATSLPHPTPDFTAALNQDINGLRLGVPREYFGAGVDPRVAATVREAVDTLEELGATCEECSTPTAEYGLPTYYIIAPAEASSNLARYDGVQYGHRTAVDTDIIGMLCHTRSEGFGREVIHRIMLGTYALSSGYYDAYYGRAQKVRTLTRQEFDRAFQQYDALVTPTSPTVAFRLGERTDDPLQMKMADTLTIPVNIAGLPGISVPCGLIDGLPVGLQIIGRALDELTVLRVAHAYERATDWHRQMAPVPEVSHG